MSTGFLGAKCMKNVALVEIIESELEQRRKVRCCINNREGKRSWDWRNGEAKQDACFQFVDL